MKNLKINFEIFLEVNLWTAWVGFYDFILNEIFPERLDEFEKFNQYVQYCQNLHLIYPFKEICFVVERPTTIKTTLNNRETKVLHSLQGPSIGYKDGYEIYSLDGIRVTKAIIDNCREKKNPKEILALENIEQRLVAIKYFGIENLLSELDSKTIDRRDEEYELLEVIIDGESEKLL